jgi:uncharacterized iron-regulated membrane protein
MNKKTWFKWHQWVGLNFSLLVCFILVTGTIAVVSHEIDWLTNSSLRVIPAVKSERINWGKIYQAARLKNQLMLIQSIKAPVSDWFAVKVIRRDKEGNLYLEYYHPESAQYQGDGRWYNWQRFFRMAHRHLMMPTIYGVTIVGITSILIFVSMISGVVIYPKFWRGFFKKPRYDNRRVFWGDTHRLFGLWSSWLLLVVCLTGFWYLLEIWGLNAVYPKADYNLSTQTKTENVQVNQQVFERAIGQIPKYHRGLVIKNIRLPIKKGRALIIEGQSTTVLVRDRANSVSFDPFTSEYLSHRVGEDQSLHVRISEAADPLHFGVFAGYYSKVIYFIFGLILSALAISGTYLYGLRSTKSYKKTSFKVTKVWLHSWTSMGHWRWLSLSIITICFVIAFLLFGGIVSQG